MSEDDIKTAAKCSTRIMELDKTIEEFASNMAKFAERVVQMQQVLSLDLKMHTRELECQYADQNFVGEDSLVQWRQKKDVIIKNAIDYHQTHSESEPTSK
jgi:hypothetical protein